MGVIELCENFQIIPYLGSIYIHYINRLVNARKFSFNTIQDDRENGTEAFFLGFLEMGNRGTLSMNTVALFTRAQANLACIVMTTDRFG